MRSRLPRRPAAATRMMKSIPRWEASLWSGCHMLPGSECFTFPHPVMTRIPAPVPSSSAPPVLLLPSNLFTGHEKCSRSVGSFLLRQGVRNTLSRICPPDVCCRSALKFSRPTRCRVEEFDGLNYCAEEFQCGNQSRPRGAQGAQGRNERERERDCVTIIIHWVMTMM